MKYIKAFDCILDIIGDNAEKCKTSEMKESFREIYDTLLIIRNYYGLFQNIEKQEEKITFENYDDEVWKPIVGYEEFYEVSNKIRIRNAKTKRCLKLITDDGYNCVILFINKKEKHLRLCRLVASTFIPNPDNKPYVDHINSHSLDDRPENLRWVTQKENMSNKRTRENMLGRGYPVLQYSLDGEFIREWDNAYVAVRTLGWPQGSSRNIILCCRKKGYNKTCKKYIWKFKKDVPPEKRYVKQEDIAFYMSRYKSKK